MRIRTLLLSLLLWAASVSGAEAQLARKRVLSLEASRAVLQAAEAHARQNRWNVVISIVDDGGHPVLLQRMDDTQTASVEIALRKAAAAAAFRRSTAEVASWVAGGATAMLVLPGAIPIAGGRPLVVDGVVVGAIGVSGVTADQDDAIAAAGVEALGRIAR